MAEKSTPTTPLEIFNFRDRQWLRTVEIANACGHSNKWLRDMMKGEAMLENLTSSVVATGTLLKEIKEKYPSLAGVPRARFISVTALDTLCKEYGVLLRLTTDSKGRVSKVDTFDPKKDSWKAPAAVKTSQKEPAPAPVKVVARKPALDEAFVEEESWDSDTLIREMKKELDRVTRDLLTFKTEADRRDLRNNNQLLALRNECSELQEKLHLSEKAKRQIQAGKNEVSSALADAQKALESSNKRINEANVAPAALHRELDAAKLEIARLKRLTAQQNASLVSVTHPSAPAPSTLVDAAIDEKLDAAAAICARLKHFDMDALQCRNAYLQYAGNLLDLDIRLVLEDEETEAD